MKTTLRRRLALLAVILFQGIAAFFFVLDSRVLVFGGVGCLLAAAWFASRLVAAPEGRGLPVLLSFTPPVGVPWSYVQNTLGAVGTGIPYVLCDGSGPFVRGFSDPAGLPSSAEIMVVCAPAFDWPSFDEQGEA